MERCISRDGTSLAFERIGQGAPVILVDGALCHRGLGPMPALAALLARDFSVFHYDRRGRGDSGDTLPHALERELDDLQALIDVAGGSAYVFGISSGAALALRAAASGMAIRKLAVFEAPFVIDHSRPPIPDDYLPRIERALAEGKRGDVVKIFLGEGVRVPAPFLWMMRMMPVWSQLTAVAHTLPYDIALLGETRSGDALPRAWVDALAAIRMPTLVLGGGKSPAWMLHAVDAVAKGIADAKQLTLKGQTHQVSEKVLAPVLRAFFAS
jgi:pimeloyl-ACP methyl ester carboxylesterase